MCATARKVVGCKALCDGCNLPCVAGLEGLQCCPAARDCSPGAVAQCDVVKCLGPACGQVPCHSRTHDAGSGGAFARAAYPPTYSRTRPQRSTEQQ